MAHRARPAGAVVGAGRGGRCLPSAVAPGAVHIRRGRDGVGGWRTDGTLGERRVARVPGRAVRHSRGGGVPGSRHRRLGGLCQRRLHVPHAAISVLRENAHLRRGVGVGGGAFHHTERHGGCGGARPAQRRGRAPVDRITRWHSRRAWGASGVDEHGYRRRAECHRPPRWRGGGAGTRQQRRRPRREDLRPRCVGRPVPGEAVALLLVSRQRFDVGAVAAAAGRARGLPHTACRATWRAGRLGACCRHDRDRRRGARGASPRAAAGRGRCGSRRSSTRCDVDRARVVAFHPDRTWCSRCRTRAAHGEWRRSCRSVVGIHGIGTQRVLRRPGAATGHHGVGGRPRPGDRRCPPRGGRRGAG